MHTPTREPPPAAPPRFQVIITHLGPGQLNVSLVANAADIYAVEIAKALASVLQNLLAEPMKRMLTPEEVRAQAAQQQLALKPPRRARRTRDAIDGVRS